MSVCEGRFLGVGLLDPRAGACLICRIPLLRAHFILELNQPVFFTVSPIECVALFQFSFCQSDGANSILDEFCFSLVMS